MLNLGDLTNEAPLSDCPCALARGSFAVPPPNYYTALYFLGTAYKGAQPDQQSNVTVLAMTFLP